MNENITPIELEVEGKQAVRDLLRTGDHLDEIATTLEALGDPNARMLGLVIRLAMAYGIEAAYTRLAKDAQFLASPIAPTSRVTYGEALRRVWP